MSSYSLDPIGVIRSSYLKREDIPRQGYHRMDVEGRAVLDEKWLPAMKGLEKFDRLVFLFLFHKTSEIHLTENRSWLGGERGVFATRSPNRPNHIGMSEVEIIDIKGLEIRFRGPDMLDGTPLIDIKPPLACMKKETQLPE